MQDGGREAEREKDRGMENSKIDHQYKSNWECHMQRKKKWKKTVATTL